MNYIHILIHIKNLRKGLKAVLIGAFLMMGLSINAQSSAKGYFNSGAKEFVHSKLKEAIATVDKGLKIYPNDENLNELRKKLEEEKKKQDQNKDKQDKKDQNKKDQDKKDQEKKEQDKKDKQDEDKKKDEEKKDQDQKDQDQKEQDKKDEEKKKEQQQPQVGQMTPEQVQQLLETMNNEEAKTQKKVNAQKVKGKKIQTEKDW